jgi:hypothetical protein
MPKMDWMADGLLMVLKLAPLLQARLCEAMEQRRRECCIILRGLFAKSRLQDYRKRL